jgi:hypothetical protein
MKSQGQRRRDRRAVLLTLAMFAVTAGVFAVTLWLNLQGVKAPWQF